MALHDGLIALSPLSFVGDPNLFGLPTDPIGNHLVENDFADQTGVPPVPNPELHEGFIDPKLFPHYHLMNEIYFLQQNDDTGVYEIDAGLIASEVTFPINFLNLKDGYDGSPFASLTAISIIDEPGTTLNSPSLPYVIPGLCQLDLILTITEDGPPSQNTTYIFTIDGVDFTLIVKASRLEALDPAFDPNWDKPFKVSYGFTTIVKRSKTFHEQRRSLYTKMKRTLTCSFWSEGEDFPKIHTVLKNAIEKLYSVPVFQEALLPTNTVFNGVGVLTFDIDLTHYFSLEKSEIVIIKSTDPDIILEQILIISSFDSSTLTFTSPVTKDFIEGKTVVYPIFNGTLKSFKPKYITDQIVEFEIKFEQFRLGE